MFSVKSIIELIKSIKYSKRTFRQFVALCIILMMFLGLIIDLFFEIQGSRMLDAVMMSFAALVGYYFGSSDKESKDHLEN